MHATGKELDAVRRTVAVLTTYQASEPLTPCSHGAYNSMARDIDRTTSMYWVAGRSAEGKRPWASELSSEVLTELPAMCAQSISYTGAHGQIRETDVYQTNGPPESDAGSSSISSTLAKTNRT